MAELNEINGFLPRVAREHNRNERDAGAQTGAQRRKASNRLIGRGGVALVMYHLARLGLEFTPTSDDSGAADLWVQTASGAIVTVEVKTSSGMSWLIRANQLTRVQVYALVDIRGAGVWIIRAADLRQIIAATNQTGNGGAYSLTLRQLPRESENAWSIFSDGAPDPVVVLKLDLRQKPARGRARRERRILKSGEVKIYEYPATP